MPKFDLIVIDEVHLLNEERGQYYKILNSQGVFDDTPKTAIVGLTATPWRNNLKMYGNDQLFPKLDLEVLTDDLIAQGYLAPYYFPKVQKVIDVSKCKKQNGDYKPADLEKYTSSDDIIKACLTEWSQLVPDRKLHLFFCTGVRHAERVGELLVALGYYQEHEVLTITGTTKDKVDLIASIQTNLQIKAVCSCEVLTTGTDIPRIDTIVMLRPTQSAVLHVQMNGRGLRLSEGKTECAIVDFAGNMQRFGSLNSPYLEQDKPKKFEQKSDTEFLEDVEGEGIGKLKTCQFCKLQSPIAARVCTGCNNLFIKKENVFDKLAASTYEVCAYTLKYNHLCATGRTVPLLIIWHTVTHGKIYEYIFTDWKAQRFDKFIANITAISGELQIKDKFKMINTNKYWVNDTDFLSYMKAANSKYTDFVYIKGDIE
jgi:DNA repair protein RadD